MASIATVYRRIVHVNVTGGASRCQGERAPHRRAAPQGKVDEGRGKGSTFPPRPPYFLLPSTLLSSSSAAAARRRAVRPCSPCWGVSGCASSSSTCLRSASVLSLASALVSGL